jgi:hypothetical protein
MRPFKKLIQFISYPFYIQFLGTEADMNFKNMDKMIGYTNELASGVNLFYSTPSCYVKAINDEAGSRPWPTKTDDFFPYSNDPHAYWTGYFTSRPAYKGTVRKANTFLQVQIPPNPKAKKLTPGASVEMCS